MSKRIYVGHAIKDWIDDDTPPAGGLDAVIKAAWEDVKTKGKDDGVDASGRYKVEIYINADNPIRSYSVTIVPVV